MRSAFTGFRYLIYFKETNKCTGCLVTISNNIQVKYCCLADRRSVYKLSLLKMTKWHAHVANMAKHMNMAGALFGGEP